MKKLNIRNGALCALIALIVLTACATPTDPDLAMRATGVALARTQQAGGSTPQAFVPLPTASTPDTYVCPDTGAEKNILIGEQIQVGIVIFGVRIGGEVVVSAPVNKSWTLTKGELVQMGELRGVCVLLEDDGSVTFYVIH